MSEYTQKQQRELRRNLSGNVKFCGCGSDESKWALLKKLLERAEDAKGPSFYEPLDDIPGISCPAGEEW